MASAAIGVSGLGLLPCFSSSSVYLRGVVDSLIGSSSFDPSLTYHIISIIPKPSIALPRPIPFHPFVFQPSIRAPPNSNNTLSFFFVSCCSPSVPLPSLRSLTPSLPFYTSFRFRNDKNTTIEDGFSSCRVLPCLLALLFFFIYIFIQLDSHSPCVVFGIWNGTW